jgi:hypothetical protein
MRSFGGDVQMVFDEIPFRHSTPFIRKDATAGSNPGIPVAPPTAAPDEIPNWYMAGAHCKRDAT